MDWSGTVGAAVPPFQKMNKNFTLIAPSFLFQESLFLA
ncbi:hypothetical protein GPEL0_01r1979 [Geoanaerobacter pelophilus]|uniref:Uncharacterized protein n=1 Tax=Geoanaerobacter pelophilus TaxID=60036 RepID=A0ABQ0MHK8_9BACT|nr:hypothetical protein GPEL0_01r1979 [Geoanaerobacter pelophilus]